MAELTHLDSSGTARMVDVSGKDVTTREAVAEGRVAMAPATAILYCVPSGSRPTAV